MAHIRISLVLDSGARIGPGKAALLESVRDNGSIAAAARAMGMDYKRAWLLIDSLNQTFDQAVVERSTGGAGGGGAVLTPFGTEILQCYRRIERDCARLSGADLRTLQRHAHAEGRPKV